MRVTAIPDFAGGAMPPSIRGDALVAVRDMLKHVSPLYGPILRACSFLGAGDAVGGGYAGHAELIDIDGLLADLYGQPSMAAGVNDTLFGGGKGFALSGVTLSTLGEAIERVVAGLVSGAKLMPSERITATYREMTASGYSCLSPSEVHLFSEEQYEQPSFLYRRFTEDVPVQWVRGRRLSSWLDVWVPAQLVDMVHIFDPNEEIVGYPVSGGLSCHTSFRDAVYHGLTEVIERDAVNVSWYTDSGPDILEFDAETRLVLGPIADRLELDHSDVYILKHHSDVCTASTFSVVGIQDWLPRRRYCAGGGCDYSPARALRKAAAEFGQTRSTLSLANAAPGSAVGRSVRTMFDWEAARSLSEITLFFQAIGFYGLPENECHLDFYFGGKRIDGSCALPYPEREIWSASDSLQALSGELMEHGIDPIVLDYSHPDWMQLNVVKVFVPELTTPFLQSRPMLGHPRLQAVRPALRRVDGNVLPLPYP